MNGHLFLGEQVRLSSDDPLKKAEAFSRWRRDSEFSRLLDSGPASVWSVSKIKEWNEKYEDKDPYSEYFFTIHTIEDDRMIGFIGLDGIRWNHGDCWVGIGLGERDYWGKGYGTDAMRIILRYAFSELNLHRVSLNVFGYNPRAIHSYEKAGFKHEGSIRQFLFREGRRWDLVHMGILKEEWEQNARRDG
ncbi:MAG: N-acetyltransferase [Chloroflexota bacterium]|nr:MAG: N-acetyltransferase [Chloroflexota bacterium]